MKSIMMRYNTMFMTLFLLVVSLPLVSRASDETWAAIKDGAVVQVAVEGYGTPYRLPLATLGWEDGIHMTRDGLSVYCTYAPGDLFSWLLLSSDPSSFAPYRRGPDYGIDLLTNPVGAASWIQSDVLVATRASLEEPFGDWERTSFSQAVYSEGGVVRLEESTGQTPAYIFTSNAKAPTFDLDIWQLPTDGEAETGAPLAHFPHTAASEDNPHWERLNESEIVLLFDSPDYAGGQGDNDIWVSVSADNGDSWSTPAPVSPINSPAKEHQPHLFRDASGQWYLYYSASGEDGKLGIFRARQREANNWTNWGDPELVIGAGNTVGVGEPTLTADGGISFVVVYEDPVGPAEDHYDADPWYLPAGG